MWLMLQQDEPDDYVIATGETHSVRELCEVAFGLVGLDWERYVRVRRALLPADRGRRAVRRRVEGARAPRLAAEDDVPGARRDHARARPADAGVDGDAAARTVGRAVTMTFWAAAGSW